MILTRENYYTPEADREYMSCSQFEDLKPLSSGTTSIHTSRESTRMRIMSMRTRRRSSSKEEERRPSSGRPTR